MPWANPVHRTVMQDNFPFPPGIIVRRPYSPSSYNDHQWALWQAFNDVYYAQVYGFGETRQASPCVLLDRGRFEAWRQKVLAGWRQEAGRDRRTSSPGNVEDIPDPLWLYWYQRVLAAPAMLTTSVNDD